MIPVFKCSEEAIDFGKKMEEAMVSIFMEEHQKHYEMSKQFRIKKQWDDAMAVAVRGQFYREAVESFQGKINR